MSTEAADQVYCRATFEYLGEVARASVELDVYDGRSASAASNFEASGFTFDTMVSAVVNWQDQKEINRVHGPEVASYAQQFTGCDEIAVYPAISRGPSMAAKTPDYAPIEFVHSDFTTDYLDMVTNPSRTYRQFLEPVLHAHGLHVEDVESASRLMVLQLWRNTGAEKPDFPLAVCDAQSVPTRRLRPFTVESYGGSRLDFETYGIAEPAADQPDRWYTFPAMSIDEVIVFRTYDSARAVAGEAFWTPHSAFRDPHVGDDSPALRRESTEMRALCIWR